VEASPQLSIIIVNHRTEAYLAECLRAISLDKFPGTIEIIIVDNPPEAEFIPLPCSGTLIIRRIATQKQIGFSKAANLGAAQARGEYLLFLNPDVILAESAIEQLYQSCLNLDRAGVVGGSLINPDGTWQPSYRRFPTVRNLLFSRGSILRHFSRKSNSYILPRYDVSTAVDWLAAAMIIIPRGVFNSVSGFDEGYYLYLEDTDLCYRVSRAGYQNYYVPSASGVHKWGASTRYYRFSRIVWHHHSIWMYFSRHHSAASRLILLPALLVNGLLSLIFELLTF
jgi:N-acetylglucosaminyl-diphospho-decaprenol L-rhamnosyltransferase